MKEWILNVLCKLNCGRLKVLVREDLPVNALSGAFNNTIVLSKKLVSMQQENLLPKNVFIFILLHEIAHLIQQSVLSKMLSKDEIADFIQLNRDSLEKNADEIAFSFSCGDMWRKVISLIDFSDALEDSPSFDYDNLSVQWWMVDGILSEALLTEDPEKAGKADDIKKDVKAAIENVKNDEELNELLEKTLSIKADKDFSDEVFDVQTAAIEEGIHETYARDALIELEKNCNQHIDERSKALNIKLSFENTGNGGRNCFTKKNGEIVHKINCESFVQGAQWNDRWHYSNINFAMKFFFAELSGDLFEKDAFVYSSHFKRMQFLHSMDCSGGCKSLNYRKIRRWTEFCIDVFNNIEVSQVKKHIQDLTIDEYVNIVDDELFRIMMRDLLDSAYGSKSIKYFFGGDKFDAGSVALGCVSHMIQDSFALSHVKRCLDPFAIRRSSDFDLSIDGQKKKSSSDSVDISLDGKDDKSEMLAGNPIQVENDKFKNCKENVKNGKEKWDYDKFRESLSRQAMPVILYANYEKQDAAKHKHADVFLTHIDSQKKKTNVRRVGQWIFNNPQTDDALHEDFYVQTLNATMARDCSEMFVYMTAMDYPKEEILNFLDSIYLSFRSLGETTTSGLQYCLKDSVENRYENAIESLMCYNFNEPLVSRIITFNRTIILLKDIFRRTSIVNRLRRNECFHHVCEIFNEIYSWTFVLARTYKDCPGLSSFCVECAGSIYYLFLKVCSCLNDIEKKADELDGVNNGETKSRINDVNVSAQLVKTLLENIMRNKGVNCCKEYNDMSKSFEEKKQIGMTEKCFVVQIISGDERCAGTDADVHLKIYGKIKDENGKVKEILVGEYPLIDNIGNSFERCSSEIFEFYTDKDVFEITSITIGHNGKWWGDKWYVDDIIVSAPLNLMESGWVFHVKDWIDKNEEMNLSAYPLEKMRYFTLKIYTGAEHWAGTNSDIYISIFTKKDGEVVETDAKLIDNVNDNFEAGDIDFFTIECQSSIDDICKIKLKNDGSDKWFVDKVVVADVITEKTWFFTAKQWVTNDKDLFLSREEGCNFVVDIYTGEQSCGGTDSNVFITILGENGETKETELNDSKNNFEQGSKDTFWISSENSIGVVTGVKIRKNGRDDWFLDKVVVTDNISGKKWNFFANCKVGNDESVSLPNPKLKSCFAIDVYTGYESNGGTDDDVFVAVHGKNGNEIPKQKLDGSKNNFEKGSKDSFTITSDVYVDEIDYIELYKEGSDDWFLNKVVVKNMLTDEVKEFVADCLIGDDECVRLPKMTVESWFTVDVYTSNKSDAGTDDDVYMSIHGKNNRLIPKQQLNNSKNNFEKKDKDTFTITSDVCIDDIDYIKVYKDGNDDWFLEKVVIKNEITKKENVFVPNRKIGKDDGPFYPHVAQQSFIVDVYTGTEFGSGTDDDVFISICGQNGEIEDYELCDSKNNFENDGKDTFVVSSEKPIGDITKIKVRLKGSGRWLLNKVVVTDIITNEEWVFMSNQWLENNEVVLTQESRTRLKLEVFTSDDDYAGTDDKVEIALYGENDKVILPFVVLDDSHNNFERGDRDLFTLYIFDDFDSIKQIGVKKDGSDKWILDKIVVTDEKTENVKVFTTNQAIEKNQEVRLLEQDSLVNFKIDVYTSNQYKAGTDGDVKIAIYGKDGALILPFTKLDNSENNFERNSKDSFIVSTSLEEKNLSYDNIEYVEITQNNRDDWLLDIHDDWLLDKIIITDIYSKTEWTFIPVPYKKITKGDTIKIDRSERGKCFLMNVYTSAESYAGTDDVIEFAVFGKEGVEIIPFTAMNDFKNNYEKKDVDSFVFNTELYVDDINEVRVRHKGVDDWYLDKIVISDAISGKEWMFVANSWIRNKEEITLSHEELRHFVIDVYTDGNLFSGTDGSVEISIDGVKKVLDNRHNNFEAGDRDSFTIHFDKPFVVAGEGGCDWNPVVKLLCNAVDGWTPEIVIISDLNSNNRWVFAPEKTTQNEFLLKKCKDYTCFEIDVYTSDETGAGTNANVKIDINGNCPQKLLNNRKDNFESGDKDSFIVVYENSVEEPSYITVSHDGSGKLSEWKLGNVNIADLVNGKVWQFAAGNNCVIKANEMITLAYRCGRYFRVDLPQSDKKIGTEISLVGEEGDIPFQKIDGNTSFSMISYSGIGNLLKIIIKNGDDQSGLDCVSGKITITDIYLGKKWIFDSVGLIKEINQVELEPIEIIVNSRIGFYEKKEIAYA